MARTSFFLSSRYDPPMLLRRVETDGIVDEAFGAGRWQPTKVIVDFMFGEDDYVEPVSETKARELAPAAFS